MNRRRKRVSEELLLLMVLPLVGIVSLVAAAVGSVGVSVIVAATLPPAPSVDLAMTSDTGSSNEDNITAATQIVFTGTAEDSTAVRILKDGEEVGNGPVTDNAYSVTISTLEEGAYDFTVVAINSSGRNSAFSNSLKVNIDKTPPFYGTPAVIPLPNSHGWHRDDAIVTFPCADDFSGPAQNAVVIAITSEGVDQTASVNAEECQDLAGNSATSGMGIDNINIDKTPPLVHAALSPGPNGNGWNNTDVTVSFNGTDGLSGLDFCDSDVLLSNEGVDLSASGRCTDLAGNVSSQTIAIGINIDKTPPLVTPALLPEPNSNGWNNTDVEVSFSGADSLSGIDSCDPDVVLSNEGVDQLASGRCIDLAGNLSDEATARDINIDKTPPLVHVTRSSEPNANGWYNSDVTVSFDGADDLSGTDFCDPEVVLTNEGAGYSISGKCVDLAGNVSNEATARDINIDQTPPFYGTPAVTPLPNSHGWHRDDAIVTFPCADDLSGPAQNAVVIAITSEGVDQTASVDAEECQDLAGNSAASGMGIDNINIDKTPPQRVPNLTSSSHQTATWSRNGDVDLSWDAAVDSLSGIDSYWAVWDTSATTTPESTGDIGSVTRITSPTLPDGDSHYFHIRAVDQAGNASDSVHLGPFWIDTTPPDTAIEGVTEGPVTTIEFDGLDNFQIAGYECRLDGGPLQGCTTPYRQELSEGTHTFEVWTIDGAGNIDPTPATHTWEVAPLTADLAVLKFGGAEVVEAGESLTYAVTVTNHGPSAATEVTVTDTLPEQVAFVSASEECLYSSELHQVTCDLGLLGVEGDGVVSSEIAIMVDVLPDIPDETTLTNIVTVDGNEEDPVTSNNRASASIMVRQAQADLSLSKAVSNAAPNEGDAITYSITLTNDGPGAATGTEVIDLLPAGLTYQSDDSQGSYDPATGRWIVGEVPAPGDGFIPTATLTIIATVNGDTRGTTIANTAQVTAVNQADPDPRDNQASARITVAVPDIAVTITSGPSVNCSGTPVQCDVTLDFEVRNLGDGDVTGPFDILIIADQVPDTIITVTDGLPAGDSMSFTVTSQPGGNCFDPDCTASVEVDSGNILQESDETNNVDTVRNIG